MEIQHRQGPGVAERRNGRAARRFSLGEEAATMDPKTRGHEPKNDRPKTGRPPDATRAPKGSEGEDTGDVERATQRGEQDFDPNVNQRPR